ncbi:KxYKxGKxW signal peptide domain-containing protein [Leuconostoc citreum]|uniref:KxYKxGKxW signal peptide domain-containing protein n=1 Tax=Leuconostoc citreum TaxID=33964 RepID=UPI0032DE6B41
MTTRYKLYKDGKKWVVGAIAVAGLTAVSGQAVSVSADTVPTVASQQTAVQDKSTNDSATTANQPTATSQTDVPTQKTDQPNTKTPATQGKKASNQSETNSSVLTDSDKQASKIPTQVPDNTTQEARKKAIDEAQSTVKDSAKQAADSGVVVTQGETKKLQLNPDNAVHETNKALQDLHDQDAQLQAAEAKQKENDAAKASADKARDAAQKQGEKDLETVHKALDEAVKSAKKSGLSVNLALAETTTDYQDLKGLTGQALLDAMAKNIATYQKAVSQSVTLESADTKRLQALEAEYKQQRAAFEKSEKQRQEAQKSGDQSLNSAHQALDKAVEAAKKAGLAVTVQVANSSPKYKDLKGLTGQALIDAMGYNVDVYQKAVASGVASEKADSQTLTKLTAEYEQAVAKYNAEKARVDKSNTEKKNAYDKLVLDRETAIKAAIAKGDQHYTGTYDLNGYYGGFLNGKVHYDYTYHWDNAKRTFVVTKVDIRFDSQSPDKKGAGFWDTVYVQGPKFAIPQDSAKGHIQGGADITENGDTLWQQIKDPKYGVLFYLSQNNKTGQVVVHQDNTAGVPYEAVQLPNGDYELARFISRNRQGNPGVRNSEYANWIVGNKVVVHSDIPTEPTTPTYEKDPIKPEQPKVTVTKHTVTEIPQAQAPVVPKTTVTKYQVADLPSAEVPAPQKVTYALYDVSTTPVPVETPAQPTPTPTSISASAAPAQQTPARTALPKSGVSATDQDKQIAMASLAAVLMGIGIAGARRQYRKNDDVVKPLI